VLVLTSVVATCIFIFGAVHSALNGFLLVSIALWSIIFGALLFTVRGYSITGDGILVHRLFWSTRLPVSGLMSVEVAPGIMHNGIRVFGNGGLFSFSGWSRNRELGIYRAFVTDPQRTVLLRYATGSVVVSPSSPDEFVDDIARSQRIA